MTKEEVYNNLSNWTKEYDGNILDNFNVLRMTITSKDKPPDLYKIIRLLCNDLMLSRT